MTTAIRYENPLDAIKVARSSTASYFDSGGILREAAINRGRVDHDPVTKGVRGLLLEEQRTNLLQFSEEFDQSYWGKVDVTIEPNSVVAPDGTVTADKVIPKAVVTTSRYLWRNPTTGNTVNTLFAKAGELRYLSFGNSARRTVVDLQLGTLSVTSDGFNNYSIEFVGNGWYKLSCVNTTATAYQIQYEVGEDATGSNIATNGTDGLYIWGAQLESATFPTSYISTRAKFTSRSSKGTYFDSAGVLQTAGVNVPRDKSHKFIGGQWISEGLLVEEQRTNVLLHNRDLSNAVWTATNPATITQNQVGLDGVANKAWTLEDTSATLFEKIEQTVITVANDSANHALTWYLKKTTAAPSFPGVALVLTGGTTLQYQVTVNTDNGTAVVRDVSPTPTTLKVTDAGDWWRVLVAAPNNSSGNTNLRYDLFPAVNTNASAAWAAGTTGSCVYDFGQVELNTTSATSPIETGASQVTRSADVVSSSQVTRSADFSTIGDAVIWFNEEEGTLYVEADNKTPQGLVGSKRYLAVSDGSTANRMVIYRASNDSQAVVVVSEGITQFSNTSILWPVNTKSKIALSYNADGFIYAINGEIIDQGEGKLPVGISTLYVGANETGPTGDQPNAPVSNVRYFRHFKTKEQLKELTK